MYLFSVLCVKPMTDAFRHKSCFHAWYLQLLWPSIWHRLDLSLPSGSPASDSRITSVRCFISSLKLLCSNVAWAHSPDVSPEHLFEKKYKWCISTLRCFNRLTWNSKISSCEAPPWGGCRNNMIWHESVFPCYLLSRMHLLCPIMNKLVMLPHTPLTLTLLKKHTLIIASSQPQLGLAQVGLLPFPPGPNSSKRVLAGFNLNCTNSETVARLFHLPPTGRHGGVVGARCHDRAVPPAAGPEGVGHQSEGRSAPQPLALLVHRDGEGLCVGDEGPCRLPPSQPCKALWHQMTKWGP